MAPSQPSKLALQHIKQCYVEATAFLLPSLSKSQEHPGAQQQRAYATHSGTVIATPKGSSTTIVPRQTEDSTTLLHPTSPNQEGAAKQSKKAAWPAWDWSYVAGVHPGRKPAIKRPKRHQWLFCDPNYDPMRPLPPKQLTPHAPLSAQLLDDREAFKRLKPVHEQKNLHAFKQKFERWRDLRDVDWRNAFQQGLAADVKILKQQKRLTLQQQRQQHWEEYRQSLLEKEKQ